MVACSVLNAIDDRKSSYTNIRFEFLTFSALIRTFVRPFSQSFITSSLGGIQTWNNDEKEMLNRLIGVF